MKYTRYTNIVCPYCSKLIKSNIYKHAFEVHGVDNIQLVLKLQGLTEVPKCINCDKEAMLRYRYLCFSDYCSSSCVSSANLKNLWKKKDFYEKRQQVSSETMSKTMYRLNHEDENFIRNRNNAASKQMTERIKDPAFRARISELSRPSRIANLKKVRAKQAEDWYSGVEAASSKIEKIILNRVKTLFPNLTIISSKRYGKYLPDMVLVEFNLIVEVDGQHWHPDLNDDIIRDKYLLDVFNLRVRRLDAEYCKHISDAELCWAILSEYSEHIPYWDRIPYSEILLWKWTPQYTQRNLLKSTQPEVK